MLENTIVKSNKNKNTDKEQVKNAVKPETLTLSVIKTQIQNKKSKEDVTKIIYENEQLN